MPIQTCRITHKEVTVDTAELSIRSWIMKGPAKPISGGSDIHDIGPTWKGLDTLRPERKRETDQEDRLNDHHSDFDVGRGMPTDTDVVRLGMAFMPESIEAVEEEDGPTHTKSQHEQMHKLVHGIHCGSVCRSGFRKLHPIEESHNNRVGLGK